MHQYILSWQLVNTMSKTETGESETEGRKPMKHLDTF